MEFRKKLIEICLKVFGEESDRNPGRITEETHGAYLIAILEKCSNPWHIYGGISRDISSESQEEFVEDICRISDKHWKIF